LSLAQSSTTTPPRDLRSRTKKRADAGADTRFRTTCSFYRYVHISDPEGFKMRLLDTWRTFGCLGRIYVAHEGINAQMNVSAEHWAACNAWVQNQPELVGIAYKIAMKEGELPSFFKLTIKVKDKIVADGLDDASFDAINTGVHLTAAEMNEYVSDENAIIVDMRNNYESEIGHFENALTPDVVTF
jgi:UPF0176 protein